MLWTISKCLIWFCLCEPLFLCVAKTNKRETTLLIFGCIFRAATWSRIPLKRTLRSLSQPVRTAVFPNYSTWTAAFCYVNVTIMFWLFTLLLINWKYLTLFLSFHPQNCPQRARLFLAHLRGVLRHGGLFHHLHSSNCRVPLLPASHTENCPAWTKSARAFWSPPAIWPTSPFWSPRFFPFSSGFPWIISTFRSASWTRFLASSAWSVPSCVNTTNGWSERISRRPSSFCRSIGSCSEWSGF